jgi:hypothetical protein
MLLSYTNFKEYIILIKIKLKNLLIYNNYNNSLKENIK